MASFSQAYAHEPTQMINTIIEIEHQRFKVMKTLHNNDTITMFVDDEDINKLCIRFENAEKNLISK